jgi:transcriptional regulator NrdR family protein
MKCPSCSQGKLDVLNVYLATDACETRNLKCNICGFRASSVTLLVERPQNCKRGRGGHALAKKIAAGTLAVPKIG